MRKIVFQLCLMLCIFMKVSEAQNHNSSQDNQQGIQLEVYEPFIYEVLFDEALDDMMHENWIVIWPYPFTLAYDIIMVNGALLYIEGNIKHTFYRF